MAEIRKIGIAITSGRDNSTILKIAFTFMSYVRYLVKCKLNLNEKDRLLKDLKSGSLARGKIFYEGM